MSFRRTCEVQPLIREAEPDKSVPLGPSEAGQLATTIGLQAQLVANFEARKDFSARRHANRGYTPSFRWWCHPIHTRACPRNMLSQGLMGAVVSEIWSLCSRQVARGIDAAVARDELSLPVPAPVFPAGSHSKFHVAARRSSPTR
jgi:hypothetical protein